MFKLGLLMDRRARHLWVVINDLRTTVTWDVDGVKKVDGQGYYRIMRRGRQIGIVWGVEEVTEQW
jgi:hypothetical protein